MLMDHVQAYHVLFPDQILNLYIVFWNILWLLLSVDIVMLILDVVLLKIDPYLYIT